MDWDKWIGDLFENAVSGIRECNPKDRPTEWEAFWAVIDTYKKWKESGSSYEEFRKNDLD